MSDLGIAFMDTRDSRLSLSRVYTLCLLLIFNPNKLRFLGGAADGNYSCLCY